MNYNEANRYNLEGSMHADGPYVDDDWLPQECIDDCSAQGSVDEAVEYWVGRLNLQAPSAPLRAYLKSFGAWDEGELDDHDANLRRLLWSMACDVKERQRGAEA